MQVNTSGSGQATVKNDSATVDKVESPFGNIKEGFISEVTYTSGEDLTTKVNKMKDLVKFTPVSKNGTDTDKMEKERENELNKWRDKTAKKKTRNPLSEKSKENDLVEGESEAGRQKIRVPSRERSKLTRRDNVERITTIEPLDPNENYPKFDKTYFRTVKVFPSRSALSGAPVPETDKKNFSLESGSLKVTSKPLEETRKRQSDHKNPASVEKQEDSSELGKKISFPKPVKDLVILKPEFQLPKKIVKFEDIKTKQKSMKPEPKVTGTVSEHPVQIKKLNFTRKIETRTTSTSTTTETPVKIKKFEQIKRNKPRGLDRLQSDPEKDKEKLNEKLVSYIKKYASNKPEIKRVPVRTVSDSDVEIMKKEISKSKPKENKYRIPPTKYDADNLKTRENKYKIQVNDHYDRAEDAKKETATTPTSGPKLKINPVKPTRNNDSNKIPQNVKSNAPIKNSEVGDADLINFLHNTNFLKPVQNTNSVTPVNNNNAEKPLRNTPTKNPPSDIFTVEPIKKKSKSEIGRPIKTRPEVVFDDDHTDEEFDYSSGFPESKLSFGSKAKAPVKAGGGEPERKGEPKKEVHQEVRGKKMKEIKETARPQTTDKRRKPETIKRPQEAVTENYPVIKPVLKLKDKGKGIEPAPPPPPPRPIAPLESNKQKKKQNKKEKIRDDVLEFLDGLENNFNRNRPQEPKYVNKGPIGNNLMIKDVQKTEQLETSTSHYPVRQNPPRIKEEIIVGRPIYKDYVTDAPYVPETTTRGYRPVAGKPVEQHQHTDTEHQVAGFEQFLRELSNVPNHKAVPHKPPAVVSDPPSPTSSSGHSFTDSSEQEDWRPITYNRKPADGHINYNADYNINNYNDYGVVGHFTDDYPSNHNYNNEYSGDYIVNDGHQINDYRPDNHYNDYGTNYHNYESNNNPNYHYSTNNNFNYNTNDHGGFNNPNNYYLDGGGSVFSSGITDYGQSFYGYHIRSPGGSGKENSYVKVYHNRPAYHHDAPDNYNNFIKNNDHRTERPIYDLDGFLSGIRSAPNYPSQVYGHDDKPAPVKSNYFWHGSSGSAVHGPKGGYVATSHQSLIRLSDNNHPLKSYHDFVVHHRY